MKLSQNVAEKRLSDLFLDKLPITEFNVCPTQVDKDWFSKYVKVRQEFLESLSDEIDKLAFFNFSKDEFINLIMGEEIPANISIRFKVPLVWGGKIEVSNLFLCRTFNDSHNMDRFIIEQAKYKTVWLPNPEGSVYLSTNNASGGPGGNSAEDRMATLTFQMARGKV